MQDTAVAGYKSCESGEGVRMQKTMFQGFG